jgi:hypothetical protein
MTLMRIENCELGIENRRLGIDPFSILNSQFSIRPEAA